MKKLFATALLLLASVCAIAQVPVSKHVYILMEENHRYSDVLLKMPYLVSLGAKYGHTTNYRADESGSLLDYLWISSGSGEHAFGCTGGGCASPITSDNIFRAVNKAGMTWKSYQESIPYAGYMGSGSGLYVKRHNPAAYYSDVISSKAEQLKMVPFAQLAKDIAAGQLPNYAFITPNLVNDAHNRTGTTDVRLQTADAWLKANLPMLLNSAPFQPGGDGVLIITFDECDGAAGGACGGATELVYTAVIGPKVKPNSISTAPYRHENALRTAFELLGLPAPYPQAANTAAPMADLLLPDGLIVYSPRDGSVNSSNVTVSATDQKAVRMEVWIDRAKAYQVVGQKIAVTLKMVAGVHRFVVVGVDAAGQAESKVAQITVQ